MKTGIILYESKYGATKKYVDWLAEETKFDSVVTSKANINKVKQYDFIIFAGGIYASGISGLSFLKKNYNDIKNKRTAVFCVGASPYDEKAFKQICEHNLKNDIKDVPAFYGRGAWDEEKMTFKDRILCKMLQKVIAKQDPKTYEPWQKALMSAAGQKCDWTDKKYLQPLLEWMDM